ncbi:MAG: bacillithiol system redox-active protein YtxJ, partial [Phycisphaeraceae bacterium]
MYETVHTCDRADQLIDSPTPVWLLKHSTACSVSAWAMREFMAYLGTHPHERGAVIVVQHHFKISERLAKRLHVRHESPQLLLVKKGRVIYSTSHSQIT